MNRSGFISVALALVLTSTISGGEIGFLEDFSLAEDRSLPLKQLIPGTEDYYYYHCLYYQQQGRFKDVEQMLAQWIKRYRYTARVEEIRNRQALLEYDKVSPKTLAFLKQRFGLRFDHQKQVVGRKTNHPTRLDPNSISRNALMKRAFSRYRNLNGFEDSALDFLVRQELNAERRRDLLRRLQRPDYENLVALVEADLKYRNSRGFGSHQIHRQMLLSQLDALAVKIPALLNNGNYINFYMTKLQPGPDSDWRNDPDQKRAHLERLWKFVGKLPPSQNSIKAHVLYRRLDFDRSTDTWSKERFMEYIKLPRNAYYINPKYLQRKEHQHHRANLNANYQSISLLPVVRNDEPLVRAYLEHFFIEEDDYKPYDIWLRDTYLKQVFAETKILNGIGDMEKWYSMLSPSAYKALKERIEIEFAPTNKKLFRSDERVQLTLRIKNVKSLIVKVYEINTFNYYRDMRREISTDIDLDGLVPNEETVHEYKEVALRRVEREFAFERLKKPGVYIVEFIGNGKSSRALIRKGRLNYLEKNTGAGHSFVILDDSNRMVKPASLWLDGHEYQSGDDGSIAVPFSNRPGRQSMILSTGGPKTKISERFSSLDSFNHRSEQYALTAGIYVERENLLKRKKAKVLIRSSLSVNGVPVSLSLLEEVKLIINSADRQNVSTAKEVPNFKLFEDRESVYEFQVPDELSRMTFTLKAKVQNLSQNKKVDLMANSQVTLNKIDTTDKVESLHFHLIDGNYILRVLGKTGEPRANRPVHLTLKHRHFKQNVNAVLQTDQAGAIFLGTLPEIVSVSAKGPEGTTIACNPLKDRRTYLSTIHGQAGQPILIPYMGSSKEALRSEISLLEKRSNTFVKDWFSALEVDGSFLQVKDLPSGDYDLQLKGPYRQVSLRVADGNRVNGSLVSKVRFLEVKNPKPLQISKVEVREQDVRVHLENATKFARVHVSATRMVPDYRAYDTFARVRVPAPTRGSIMRAESVFVSGRKIGDEYRYIIDRKFAKKHPGNMLKRPELLLNPWSIRTTETGEQHAAGGEKWNKSLERQRKLQQDKGRGSKGRGIQSSNSFPNLDFLGQPGVLLANLRPKNGIVTIDRKKLGDGQQLKIIAVDPETTVYRGVSLPEVAPKYDDLRLVRALDPKQKFTEQKQVSAVKGGGKFILKDITTSKFEVYDSFGKVYALLNTLSGNATLREFSFIVQWPKLKPKEKQEKYSKYACHELSFFIFNKDPDFFRTVVKPYLANKKDKTFIDRWLLGDKLDDYLDPWTFSQLNIVERILLGQSIKNRKATLARHVKDGFDMLPPNIERFNHLFKTAIKGSALETGDAFGFLNAKKSAVGLKDQAQNEGREMSVSAELASAGKTESAGFEAPGGRLRTAKSKPRARKAPAASPALKELEKKKMQKRDALAGEADDEMPEADQAFYKSDAKAREEARQFYRKLEKTMEWAENNYYKLPIKQQTGNLITVNPFWNDYAAYSGDGGFFSTNFPKASRNFPEMMFALSVLDIPFEAQKHEANYDGEQMNLAAGSTMIVFHKEILDAEEAEEKTPILVSQNFFRHNDRYRYVNNERLDKYVTDEFVMHVVYGSQVILTNPTSSRQKLDVLLQIPQGAIPVMNGFYTRSFHWDLQPFSTRTFDYYFYFPAAGNYTHFPVHVAKNEKLIARGEPTTLKVVLEPTRQDRTSWQFVSQNGSNADVLTFLRDNNLNRVDMQSIAFRMRNREFFNDAIALLRSRHTYHHTLWSYGILHNDANAIRDYLLHRNNFVQQTGGTIATKLVTFDPIERRTYEHLEYKPLVNARAHRLGKRREILNVRFFQQYHNFLKVLSYHPKLDDKDLMAVSYYMLLQDRVEEANGFFKRIDRKKVDADIQHDYLRAWLAMSSGEIGPARLIAKKHEKHPVDRWRNRFAEVKNHLDEIEGEGPKIEDEEDRKEAQTKLAATAPGFDFKVEAKKVSINYQNLSEALVNYYLMDIELLFSRNPFVQQHSGHFSYIQPNETGTVKLPKGKTTFAFDLPKKFHNRNVMVEIQSAGIKKSQPYFSNSIGLQVIENYGQVRVTHQKTGKPLSGVYVKVYARMKNGRARFYKDGYTDLRGRFDFTSLNTNVIDQVRRFSVLVLSETDGAVVREANPPKM